VADPAANERRPRSTSEARTGVTQVEREQIDAPRRPRAPDRGATFVELLVAIVLLGTVVVGTLTALRATVIAGEVDDDHASAYAWLQAGADAIDAAAYVACNAVISNNEIVHAYQMAADGALAPEGWGPTTGAFIEVVSVEYLSRSGTTETWGATCAITDVDNPLYAQLVTVSVTDPDGEFTASLEVIKGA
jgi:hypothetical protein